MSNNFEKIRQIIIKQLNLEEEQITADASFTDDLGADSIDTVELVMALETEFNIEIPEEDTGRLIKVNDVVSYIEVILNQKI